MYRTISTELWTDPAIDGLPRDGKLLFLYLITNPHTHLSGIYYLRKETIVQETKIPDRVLDTLLDTLSGLKKVWYDDATKTILIANMFGYQGKGQKNDYAAAQQLASLHKSPLILKFLQLYPHLQQICQQRGYCLWIRYPIDTPSIGVPDLPVPVPDPSSSVPDPSSEEGEESEKGETDGFERFWAAYPKKVGKKAAARAFRAAKDRPRLADLLRVLEQAKESDQWQKDGGRFIPNPATWLNQGRWADQLDKGGDHGSRRQGGEGFADKDYRTGVWGGLSETPLRKAD